jgi:EAL domain-containing protein (putative c-di-GMP-specific phosphodiesterase class I)
LSLLEALKAMGVRLAIDDFGTGYSSLSYLRRFPIDALKIDQSFVRDIASDADDTAIIGAVIGMGKNLNHRVIAEGVETAEQLAFLRTRQCDEGQGFLFSPPVSAEDFACLLVAAQPPAACKRREKSASMVLRLSLHHAMCGSVPTAQAAANILRFKVSTRHG